MKLYTVVGLLAMLLGIVGSCFGLIIADLISFQYPDALLLILPITLIGALIGIYIETSSLK